MVTRAKFRVYRYNPEKDSQPRHDEFVREVEKRTTVLDALEDIKHEQDGSLTFRRSCRSGVCGSCAMRINGYAKLACKTRAVEEMARHGTVLVEPLGNMKPTKDLAVDMKLFWDKMEQSTPWLMEKETQPGPLEPNPMQKEQMKIPNKMLDCIMCGACVSDCVSLEFDKAFLAPAALAKAYRFVADPRDEQGEERVDRLIDLGLWTCTHCHFCVSQCPRDVGPMYAISALRVKSIERGFTDNEGARHVKAFSDTVRKHGMLNEASLLLKTMRMRVLGEAGLAVTMARRGKVPPLFKKPIPKIEEVRQIFKETERRR